MTVNLRFTFLFILLVFSAGTVSAQKFVWEAGFKYKFDNREYGNDALDESATYYGARLTPQVGLGWGEGNALMLGADLMADFGSAPFSTPVDVIFYYRYLDPKFGVYAGRFPRKYTIGTYSNAFFSEYVSFYDSNFDGLLAHYQGGKGYVEFICDWNSMLTDNQREKFGIYSAGRLNLGMLYGGYNLSLFHHAHSKTERGVVDNILVYPFIGADFAPKTRFSNLYIQVGWLQAFQNDRRYIDKYVTPGGIQVDFRVERWGFGIYNSFYGGEGLMPYYKSTVAGQPDYGNGLYSGEPFYRADIYNRLEIYWQRNIRQDISVKISSVHHYAQKQWVWQQILSLQVTLSDRMFKKKPTAQD